MKKFINLWPIWSLLIAVALAFYPSLVAGKIPLNGNNLVAFFSPWIYQSWDGYPTGVPSKPGILDQLRIYYPYMRLTQESYRLGQLPLWNPYNFAGNPHMAEWQSGAFYPLHILLPFLPLPVYWTFYQIVGIFLAALFTYLYLRHLSLHKLAAVFGGLSFAFSTFMFTWNAEVVVTPHSIMWLPAMLLLADKFLTRTDAKYWLLFILSGVASVLSGYWQTSFYVLVISALYILIRQGKLKIKLLLLSAFLFIAGLTAFHLLPTAELYSRSSRPVVNLRSDLQEILKGYLLKPQYLITYLVPDFFGHPATRNNFSHMNGTYYEWALFIGTIPILLLPLILLANSRSKKLSLIFIAIAVAAGSFSFDLPHARWIFDAQVPVLSTGIANRILFIPAFFLSLLAGLALDGWLTATDSKRRRFTIIAVSIGLLVVAGLWVFLWKLAPVLAFDPLRFPSTWYLVSRRNAIIPTIMFVFGVTGLLVGTLSKKLLTIAAVTIVVAAISQNLYQFHKFTPFSESKFVYPPDPALEFLQQTAGINRFIGYNGVFLNYNFATQYQIFSVEGYDSLNDFRRTQILASASKHGQLTTNLSRSADVTLDRSLDNPGILRLMQLSGIKYLVDHPEFPDALDKASKPTLPQDKQKLVFQNGDWTIYEYLDAFPRAFLVGDLIVQSDDQAHATAMFDPQIDLRQTVILFSKPTLEISPDPNSQVEVISYTPNKIVFQTISTTNQLLFLSDTYYPGWWTTIDGGPRQPVLPADFAFRAVPVPAGTHTLTMYYLPTSFTYGLTIAGITLAVMLLVITSATRLVPVGAKWPSRP